MTEPRGAARDTREPRARPNLLEKEARSYERPARGNDQWFVCPSGAAGRANSKKYQVTGPIRGFCALQAEAEQVERTRRNDLVSGRIRGFCALQDLIHPLACPTPESWRHSRAAFELCSP